MIRSRLAAAAAGLLAAGMVMLAAGPAMADTGMDPTSSSTSLPLCAAATSPPPLYTAKCAPGVGGTAPGVITVTLPGVGTLTFTVKADGTIDTTGTPPKATNVPNTNNFTAGTPTVSSDGTHVTVTFFNAATPTQTYTVKAKVSPPTSVVGALTVGAPTVSAVAKPAGKDDDQNEAKETEGDNDDESGQSTTLTSTTTKHSDNESSTGSQHESDHGSKGGSQGHGGGGD